MSDSKLLAFTRHQKGKQILFAEEYIGRNGKRIGRNSVSTFNNLAIIENLLEAFKPKSTMEIGMATGASTIVTSLHHSASGQTKDSVHVSIDPFQSSLWDSVGLDNLDKLDLSPLVECRENFSCLELPRLIQEGRTFDFIYIDGSHIYEDVLIDFYFSSRLLSKDGVIMFDDSQDVHVKKVLKLIYSNFAEHYTPIDLTSYRPRSSSRQIRAKIAHRLRRTQATAFRKIGSGVREWNSQFTNF